MATQEMVISGLIKRNEELAGRANALCLMLLAIVDDQFVNLPGVRKSHIIAELMADGWLEACLDSARPHVSLLHRREIVDYMEGIKTTREEETDDG